MELFVPFFYSSQWQSLGNGWFFIILVSVGHNREHDDYISVFIEKCLIIVFNLRARSAFWKHPEIRWISSKSAGFHKSSGFEHPADSSANSPNRWKERKPLDILLTKNPARKQNPVDHQSILYLYHYKVIIGQSLHGAKSLTQRQKKLRWLHYKKVKTVTMAYYLMKRKKETRVEDKRIDKNKTLKMDSRDGNDLQWLSSRSNEYSSGFWHQWLHKKTNGQWLGRVSMNEHL